MKTMGERICQKRTEANMTMEELGAILGVQKSAINKWEKGEVINIKRPYIKQMADLFHVSTAWLMGMDDAPDVSVTYSAPGKEDVILSVDGDPIIGKSAEIARTEKEKRAALYATALLVRPENLDVATELLKSLS